MYDRSDLYLNKQDAENPQTPPCPYCGGISARKMVVVSEYGLLPVVDTYTCLECQRDFRVDPMDDDESIPF
jgi:hypothetical protein